MLENAHLLESMLGRFEKYQKWLERQPLSDQTRRAYVSRINGFLGFLGTSGEDLKSLIANDQERKHVLLDRIRTETTRTKRKS